MYYFFKSLFFLETFDFFKLQVGQKLFLRIGIKFESKNVLPPPPPINVLISRRAKII